MRRMGSDGDGYLGGGARRSGKEEGKRIIGEGSTAYIFDALRALEIAEVSQPYYRERYREKEYRVAEGW